jgi:hypothetical protein
MTLESVRVQEREGLMAEYAFTDMPPVCAVSDMTTVQRLPSGLRAKHPVFIDELKAAAKAGALVQRCPSLNYKFLWTHIDDDDYRERYIGFLNQCHGMQLKELPSDYHVDHLFNRQRARGMNLPFVRMVLLPKGVNTSHGAGYEKSRTQGGIGRLGRERGLDEVMLLKLWGILSPRKGMPLTSEMKAHVLRMASQFGIPAAEIERNIRELMEVASFTPRE